MSGIPQTFMYAEDVANTNANALVGFNPYQVWLVNVNKQIGLQGQSNVARIVLNTRITIGPNDGYNILNISFNPTSDGYNNPIIKLENNKILTQSGGQLNATVLLVGPIVFPYNINPLGYNSISFIGGTDPSIFQPAHVNKKNSTTFIQVIGAGLATTGNLFRISEVEVDTSGIFYHLKLFATGIGINGEPQ
jgi:hypothetical protein